MACSCDYVNEHQRDLDLLVQLLTYAYNTQVHRKTGTIPSCWGLLPHLRQHPEPTTFVTPTILRAEAGSETLPKAVRLLLLRRIGTEPPSVRMPVNNSTKDIMTPMREKKHVAASVRWYMWMVLRYPHLLQKNVRRSIFNISHSRPWTKRCHVDELEHNYYRPGPNSKHYSRW